MWWNRGYVFAMCSRWACYATGIVRDIPLGAGEGEEGVLETVTIGR